MRRIAEPHSYGRGRLRRETAGSRYRKTAYGLFSLRFFQITDRPRKMRQYRLNRESILYIEGRRPANTPCGHRESCLDEFETLPIPTLRRRRPLRKKMKPQPRFKALAGIFYRGYYACTSRRLLVFQSVCGDGGLRLAGCENSQTFGTQPIFGAFREPPPNPRLKSRDCAEHATPDFFGKTF